MKYLIVLLLIGCTPDPDKLTNRGKLVCNDQYGKQLVHALGLNIRMSGRTLTYGEKARTGEIVQYIRILTTGETCSVYP